MNDHIQIYIINIQDKCNLVVNSNKKIVTKVQNDFDKIMKVIKNAVKKETTTLDIYIFDLTVYNDFLTEFRQGYRVESLCKHVDILNSDVNNLNIIYTSFLLKDFTDSFSKDYNQYMNTNPKDVLDYKHPSYATILKLYHEYDEILVNKLVEMSFEISDPINNEICEKFIKAKRPLNIFYMPNFSTWDSLEENIF